MTSEEQPHNEVLSTPFPKYDRAALLDIATWASITVDDNTTNDELVQKIAVIQADKYRTLSARGLIALAKIRGIEADEEGPRENIERRLRQSGGLRAVWRRKRREILGNLLSKALRDDEIQTQPGTPAPQSAKTPRQSLKEHIEAQGVVGGLAEKLRGSADDFIARKLDEIELRVDQKLEEIDEKLAEWRDREIANRLKILKITLIFSILVACISLGYDYLRSEMGPSNRRMAPDNVHVMDGTNESTQADSKAH